MVFFARVQIVSRETACPPLDFAVFVGISCFAPRILTLSPVSDLNSLYRRIAARRGKNAAYEAVARTIPEINYHMIRDDTHFVELGADYFTERNREEIKKRSVKCLESLGYAVTIEDAA
jgi:hypothetical protein